MTSKLDSRGAARAEPTFYGIVRRISWNSVNVDDPLTHQTLCFEILPTLDQILSSDGKTTYQMKDLKRGRYVGIIYQQKTLGRRHADQIYLLTNRNDRVRGL